MEQLSQQFNLCKNALQKITESVQSYQKDFETISNVIQQYKTNAEIHNAFAMPLYEELLVYIQSILQATEVFNSHLSMQNISKSISLLQTLQNPSKNGTISRKLNEDEKENAVNDSNFYKNELQLNLKNLSAYQEDVIINAAVTYVKDLEDLIFYVCDEDSAEFQEVFSACNALHTRQYKEMPSLKVIFGLVVDDVVVRAIRLPESKHDHKRKHFAYLLDLGEEIQIRPNQIMYNLPIELQQLPSQAICCQLIAAVEREVRMEQQIQLKKLEYHKIKLRIISKQVDKLIVELYAEESLETAKPSAVNEKSIKEHKTTTAAQQLTEAELDMLYEEPLNTSNAIKAVTGFASKDHERICRFYDPKIRGCFKGSNCRQQHIPMPTNEYTKEVQLTNFVGEDNLNAKCYSRGKIINITITFITSPEKFYAQINEYEYAKPLGWKSKHVQCKQWSQLPLMFDIVLAKYTDDIWYRAQVCETNEQEMTALVFFVDYGNKMTVPLKHLAPCNKAISSLPHRAVMCRWFGLRDVAEDNKTRKTTVKILNDALLNQTLSVIVRSHSDSLWVEIVERKHAAILESLVDMGVLTYTQMYDV